MATPTGGERTGARHRMIDRTVDAVVLAWDDVAGPGARAVAARRQVRALLAAGLDVAVLAAGPAEPVRRRLGTTSGRMRVLADDRGGEALAAVRCFLTELGARGIGSDLVLLIGNRFARCRTAAPAGPYHGTSAEITQLLAEQLRRRRARRVPTVRPDPEWTVRLESGDPLHQRILESIGTLGAGGFGTRGAVEEPVAGATPLLLADGTYAGPGTHGLLPGPSWTRLYLDPPAPRAERILDLRTGALFRCESADGLPLRTVRFMSAARPGVVALRAEAEVGRLRAGTPLTVPEAPEATCGRLAGLRWARTNARAGGGIGAVARQRVGRDGSLRTVERLAAYVTDPHRKPGLGRARDAVEAASAAGFDRLLREQRAAWAQCWREANVVIDDDPATQLAVRYALYQLRSNVSRRGEAAVGARGLSGAGYAGHVFWDAEAFVLPALVSVDPDAAWAMLTYRLRRLDAARAAAVAGGYAGARFPWESAATGEDVTPRSGRLGAENVAILTGQQEEHITADVAWAANRYLTWTAHDDRHERLMPLLVETARYWSSRCRRAADGSAHIDAVIGPDEYHETVTDNAFTNVMARWNLRAGAASAERAGLTASETAAWRELADRLVDGYDPTTGRYEQFAGYFDLEPLVIADFAPPPVAADVLLGRARVSGSQLIKQPDVLMLHHLIPECTERGSLAPNLDYYLPRTAHGSSLSPSVCAALLARAGRPDDALQELAIAVDLDLHDRTGMTAGGLHLANLAGIWLALLTGFAGVSVTAGTLCLDPHLPSTWRRLEICFHCLGAHVRLEVDHLQARLYTDRPVAVRFAEQPRRVVAAESRWVRGAQR